MVKICGIAGYLGIEDRRLLSSMIDVVAHRGPDDRGFFEDRNLGLGNARLSVIDLQTGHQPMTNEDGTVAITYNGEVYNFRELRSDLERKAHRFATSSDTETILHAYEEYDLDFVNHLNGMFAFALWDSTKHRLVLARDRFGIKPLHYAIADRIVIFGSEAKSILQYPIARKVSLEGLHALINLQYLPGDLTLFEGVRKVMPGEMLVFENGSMLQSIVYWDIPRVNGTNFGDTSIDELRNSLEEAIPRQLVADVPVGAFLSGGLDTSTIVAFASKALAQPLKTFCMGFGEPTDEFSDARLIADHFGTDHHEITVNCQDAMSVYPEMIWHMEAPKINLYPWFVSKLVRRYVKVCLSGVGGDELFAGYFNRYRNALRLHSFARRPLSAGSRFAATTLKALVGAHLSNPQFKSRLEAISKVGDSAEMYSSLAGAFPPDVKNRLFNYSDANYRLANFFAPYFSSGDFLQGLINAELRTKLPDDLLASDDAMSMAHSLEVRVPLLDNRVVDCTVTLPWRLKYISGTWGKLLLRKLMSNILPAQSLSKPKWGFSVDVYSWYEREMGELAQNIIPESDVVGHFFKRNFLIEILERKPDRRYERYYRLIWNVLGFHFWHRIFIEGDVREQRKLSVEALA